MPSVYHRLCIVLMTVITVLSTAGFDSPAKNRSYYESRGDIVWEAPTSEKLIALTFDDGPDPAVTPIILDVLKQFGAHATFFLVGGRVERFRELVARQAAEGHELANHTYNHIYFQGRFDPAQLEEEINRTRQAIAAVAGESSVSTLFRPPGGYYNDAIVNTAKRSGCKVVLWSWHQDTKDWRSPGVNRIVRKVLDNARNGDIVLFHDHVEGRPQTADALKQILPELKQRGYRFVTVSELLKHQMREREQAANTAASVGNSDRSSPEPAHGLYQLRRGRHAHSKPASQCGMAERPL